MAETRRSGVLLTVSGSIPRTIADDVESGRRPRVDYLALADRLEADIVDIDRARLSLGRLGPLLHRIGGSGALLSWFCFRHRREYEVVLTDGEQVGLPLALLERLFGRGGSRHAMIVHIVSVRKKSWPVRLFRLAPLVDRYFVYSSSQGRHLRDAWRVPAERVVLTPFMVDTTFFSIASTDVARRRLICSAGLERRDYPTLIEAVDGLDVEVVIAAASPWSRRDDSTSGRILPENVTVARLDLAQLRDLYASALAVVMPLEDVDFQAGITTILEAMAMALPVVCTRTAGQTDTIQDGVTGRYVPPRDPAALRAAIIRMLRDPSSAAEMGRRGREWAVAHAELDRYVERIASEVSAMSDRGARS